MNKLKGLSIDTPGIRKEGKNVFVVDVFVEENKDRKQTFLLTSDRHRDNPKADRKLMAIHLKEAKERNAKVFDFGDFFCAMQGKGDPRSSKGDIRPEHDTTHYLDSLVETAVDWMGDYHDLFYLITEGNHETAVKKHRETDLIQRLVAGTNVKYGSKLQAGPYSGRVIFQFRDKHGNPRGRKVLNYHHGAGGGGAVTKGILQVGRRLLYLPDADVTVQGHIHEHWYFPIEREKLTQYYTPYIETTYNVCCGTYKEEYLGGSGYHIENWRPPKSMKMWWMEFFWNTRIDSYDIRFISTD